MPYLQRNEKKADKRAFRIAAPTICRSQGRKIGNPEDFHNDLIASKLRLSIYKSGVKDDMSRGPECIIRGIRRIAFANLKVCSGGPKG